MRVYLCFHTDVGGETDAHQFDVVADEVHLLVQGDAVLLIVIQHMAQQSAQFLHGSLCLVGIEGDVQKNSGSHFFYTHIIIWIMSYIKYLVFICYLCSKSISCIQ